MKEKPVGSYLVKDAEENKDHQLELFFVRNFSFIGDNPRKKISIDKSEIQFGLDFALSKGEMNFYIACGRHTFMEFLRKHIETNSDSLQYPVLRKIPFSLQELARSNIRKSVGLSFDGISQLELPEELKKYLEEHKYMDCSLTVIPKATTGTIHFCEETGNCPCTTMHLMCDSDSSDWDSDSEDENENQDDN